MSILRWKKTRVKNIGHHNNMQQYKASNESKIWFYMYEKKKTIELY